MAVWAFPSASALAAMVCTHTAGADCASSRRNFVAQDNERYLNVARQIRDRLSERHWSEVVDVSRTMTMDCMSLDDVPAVALAFCRATMLSVSIESGSDFIREQMPA
jgi:uncharacterized alpha-E superfamily protein